MPKEKLYIKSKTKKYKFTHYSIRQEVITLLKDLAYLRPTLVQSQSLPISLQPNLKQLCMILYAHNGAGKTLAFLIPILNSLQNIPDIGEIYSSKIHQDKQILRPQAIIIVPTEVLRDQIQEILNVCSKYYEMHYKWKLRIGIADNIVCKPGHIIIGLTKKITSYLIEKKFDSNELKWIIFDQCDMTLNNHQNDFNNFLNYSVKNNIQANYIVTSATGDKIKFRQFMQNKLSTHNILQLDSKSEDKGLTGVKHYYILSDSYSKLKSIRKIISLISKTQQKPQMLIFFSSIKQAQKVYDILKKQKQLFVVNNPTANFQHIHNININFVHSKCGLCNNNKPFHQHNQSCLLTKGQRVKKFRNQQYQILLGTEGIARGVDIRTITLVINYSEPIKSHNKTDYCPDSYIQRVGRTGRYSDEGIALIYIQDEKFVGYVEQSQKIQFRKMQSQENIIEETIACYRNNREIIDENY